MEIQAHDSQLSSNQPIVPGNNPAAELQPDDFLQLLVKQLETQDPLNPMESEEFTAQLTQFNSLDQLISLNKKIDAMVEGQIGLNNLQTTAFIGQEVIATGSEVSLDTTGTADIHYDLQANATRVAINITDDEGFLVRTLELGAQNAGEQVVAWDGTDDIGASLSTGVYHFEINAFDSSGEIVDARTWTRGVVTGVDLGDGEPRLSLGDLQLPIGSVTQVRATQGK